MITTKADRYVTDWLAKAQFARMSTELGEPWPATQWFEDLRARL